MTLFDLLDAILAAGTLNRTFFIMYGSIFLAIACVTVLVFLKTVEILTQKTFTLLRYTFQRKR
jgi:hypothetical protein